MGQGSIKNLNFSFLGQVFQYFCWVSKRVNWGLHHIPILFVGSQSVSIGVRIIWYQSTGSKISFLSLLSFVSCYHQKKKKKKKDFKKEIENRKNIVRSFNSLKSKYCFLLSSSFDLVFLSYFLAIGISLNTTSWISFSSLLVKQNWKEVATSGKRQESVRLISGKSQFKSETRVWVT